MTLTMYDSISVANLPRGASCYAGYVGGFWPTFAELKALFPKAHLLSIAVNTGQDADCLDVEPGDATATQAPAWVRRQHERGGKRPCLYASAANIPSVLRALSWAGIKRDRVRLWSAHYGLGPHICGPASCKYPGVPAMDGTQYTSSARGARGSAIDASVLRDDFFKGGGVMAVSKADIAAIAEAAAKAVAEAVWTVDGIVAAPQNDPGNQFWSPAHILTDTGKQIRALRATLSTMPDADAIAAAVVAALPPAAEGGLTEGDVQTAVKAVFAKAFTGG